MIGLVGLILGFAFVAYLRTTDAYARFIVRCVLWMEQHGL